jgi:hypothetical protein
VSVKNRRAWLILAGAVGLAACGGSGGGSSISSKPLGGTINGQPWVYVDGQTDFFLSSTSDKYFASLYDRPIAEACTVALPPGEMNYLVLNIPKMTGSFTQGGTFQFPDPTTGRTADAIATTGSLEVTAISATEISGGVKMAIDANNTVDGQFTVSICQQ